MKKEFLNFAAKSTFIFVLVIVAIAIAGVLTYATIVSPAQKNTEYTFSVEGKAEKKVTPDSATIQVGFQTDGTDITKIQTDAQVKVNKAIEDIKAVGIDESKIQTNLFSIEPIRQDYTGSIKSYRVNVEVTVTVNNTNPKDEQLSKIIKAANSAGLNEVRGLNFFIEDQDTLIDELRLAAIEDATSKAKTQAEKAGLKLGEVKTISYGGGYTPYYLNYEGVALDEAKTNSSAPSITIQPGQQELTVTVSVIYEVK